jgi:hypothetical protein
LVLVGVVVLGYYTTRDSETYTRVDGIAVSSDGAKLFVCRNTFWEKKPFDDVKNIVHRVRFGVWDPAAGWPSPKETELLVLGVRSRSVEQKTGMRGAFAEIWCVASWAPSGEWLALSIWEAKHGPWGIWRWAIKDNTLVAVSRPGFTPGVDHHDILERPLVSPNGGFVMYRSANAADLFTQPIDSSRPTRITNFGDVERCGYCWGPDGTTVYFGAERGGIWVVGSDGAAPRCLPESEKTIARSLALSASGEWLAYVNLAGDLYVTPSIQFAPSKVSSMAGISISWSQADDLLAFVRFVDIGEPGRIGVWSPHKQIDLELDVFGHSPVWAVGATKLVFVSFENDEEVILSYDLQRKIAERLFP